MSNTDKDRPYWVRCLDPHEDRLVDHNCGWLGWNREVVGYGMRTVRRYMDVDHGYHASYLDESGRWVYEKTIRKEWVAVEEYGPIYAQVYVPCDLHVPARSFTESEAKHCGYRPMDFHRWYNNSPGWWKSQTVTTPRRRRDRDVLKDAVKWQRADPEGFAEDFDLGYDEPHVPYYW